MKIIIPLICTLFLLGCNDSTEKVPAIQNTNVITEDVNVVSANEPQVVIPKTTEAETKPVTKPKHSSTPKEVNLPTAEVQSKHEEIDSSALFGTKCASCHGAKADKQALGKSQVIAGWTVSRTEEALHGYKSGTYGKEMKAVMQGQAKSLNPEEIKSLAKYIEKL